MFSDRYLYYHQQNSIRLVPDKTDAPRLPYLVWLGVSPQLTTKSTGFIVLHIYIKIYFLLVPEIVLDVLKKKKKFFFFFFFGN